jgi:hypothetical protein
VTGVSRDMHKRFALLAILLASGIAVAGCSSATPAAAPQPGVPSRIGQQATNLGAAVTVTSVTAAPSIALNQSGYRPGSGYEAYTDTPAGAGEKYVLVSAHVVNNEQKPMDLSCAVPLKTFAMDDQSHQYAPMDQLFKLKGNPQCDEAVDPGQAADMTWVYRVPAEAHMVGWEFQENNGGFFALHRKDSPTLVQLGTPVT